MKKLLLAVLIAGATATLFAQTNVGIGTNTPVNKLDVIGSIGTAFTGLTTGSVTLDQTYSTILASPGTTISLPQASLAADRIYTIIYNGAAGGTAVTVNLVSGGDLIGLAGNASTTLSITEGTVILQSGGSDNTWHATAVSAASGSNNYIQNQTLAAQVAGFEISGNGIFGGNVVVGTGESSGSPIGTTLRAPNGSGSNITGGNLTIAAGNGTGSGGSGSINFQTAPAGASGSTADALTTHMVITNNGSVGIGTSVPSSSAILDLTNNTSNLGLLPPSMNTSTRNAISAPALGLTVFNTDNDCIDVNMTAGTSNWMSTCPCNAAPAAPGSISGTSTNLCTSTPYTYTISPVLHAQYYTWTPTNGTINSGQGTTSVSASFSSTSGGLIVTASNACGTSGSMAASLSFVPIPTVPTWNTNPAVACNATTTNFTINSVSGTSYVWTVTGTGNYLPNTTQTQTVVASGTTETVAVYFVSGSGGGTVSVYATNSCNNNTGSISQAVTLPTPTAPTAIAPTNNNTGTSFQANWNALTFSPVVTSYNLNVSLTSGGADVVGPYTGITGTSYSVTGLTCGTSYYYKVTPANCNGNGTASLWYGPVVAAAAAPTVPVPSGYTTVIANATGITYSIAAVTNATNYSWTATGGGASITSATSGASLTSVTVKWTGGTVGTKSAATTIAVTVTVCGGATGSNSLTPVYSGGNYSSTTATGGTTWPASTTGWGVTTYNVQLWGAGGCYGEGNVAGGSGAYVAGTLVVPVGTQINTIVGGAGVFISGTALGGGGSANTTYSEAGGGGGGRTAIQVGGTELATAGGGGGADGYQNCNNGSHSGNGGGGNAGGGLDNYSSTAGGTGTTSASAGGGTSTAHVGAAGALSGSNSGTPGTGTSGGTGGSGGTAWASGGGGGGGYYGGGGGAGSGSCGNSCGGGGGGSSYYAAYNSGGVTFTSTANDNGITPANTGYAYSAPGFTGTNYISPSGYNGGYSGGWILPSNGELFISY